MKVEDFVIRAGMLVDSAESLLKSLDPQAFRDACKGIPLRDAAALQRDMSGIVDRASAVKAELQKRYDFIRFTLVPDTMEDAGVESAKIEGVGRISLSSDINVSVRAGKSGEAQVWLVDTGNGDLIKETINSSSLKALVKAMMKKGEEIPEDIFNISPFTRAQINKS